MLKLLAAFVIVLLSAGYALAQSCLSGPAAPSQASAAGFNCLVYNWGSGDTLAQIDSTGTGNPGFKLYLMQTNWQAGQHVATAADFSFEGSGAHRLTIQPVPGGLAGAPAILDTCQWSPSLVVTAGTSFTGGYYAEFVAHWNTTGADMAQGHVGSFGLTQPTPNPSGLFIETDTPDGGGFGVQYVNWNGGSPHLVPNTSGTTGFANQTVQNGDKWGILSTATGVNWWFNDAPNGTPPTAPNFAGDPGFGTDYLNLYNHPNCIGILGNATTPTFVDSLRVWQGGPPPPPPNGGGRWHHGLFR